MTAAYFFKKKSYLIDLTIIRILKCFIFSLFLGVVDNYLEIKFIGFCL